MATFPPHAYSGLQAGRWVGTKLRVSGRAGLTRTARPGFVSTLSVLRPPEGGQNRLVKTLSVLGQVTLCATHWPGKRGNVYDAHGPLRQELAWSLLKTAALLGLSALLVYAVLPKLAGDYRSVPVLDSARSCGHYAASPDVRRLCAGRSDLRVDCRNRRGGHADERYDRLAWNFTQLFALAVMATAVSGVAGLGALVVLYPKFMNFLGSIFSPTYLAYAGTIVLNAILLVLYYATWQVMKGRLKWLHIGIGALLNISGTVLMCIANAWTTFMMSPAGVTEAGKLVSLAQAIQNPLWWPINIHRFIANIAFGGALAAAYAAIRFLLTQSEEERAHYDWMGYVGNFVAMWALILLPFAGYYLGKEMYAYSAQMGTTLMGGAFSWLFIIQAVLIGVLFIGANYYMWLGLGRIPGGHRYYKYVLSMEILIFVSMAVWMTRIRWSPRWRKRDGWAARTIRCWVSWV